MNDFSNIVIIVIFTIKEQPIFLSLAIMKEELHLELKSKH